MVAIVYKSIIIFQLHSLVKLKADEFHNGRILKRSHIKQTFGDFLNFHLAAFMDSVSNKNKLGNPLAFSIRLPIVQFCRLLSCSVYKSTDRFYYFIQIYALNSSLSRLKSTECNICLDWDFFQFALLRVFE